MKRLFPGLMALISVTCLITASPDSRADNLTREFIMSCTYGVMAGTLVGAASLAFTNRPGDNLNRVARGASLGLYTGILLGVYVVYIIPSMEPKLDEDPVVLMDRVPLMVEPLITENKIDGARADWKLYRF